MEAEDGYKVETEETGTLEGARPTNPRTVAWRGDWDILKEEFGAAARLTHRAGRQGDKDGVGAWTRLVKHFEYTAKGLRAQELHTKWENEFLRADEHPELFHVRLLTLQRQLEALINDGPSQDNLTRKFLAEIRKGNAQLYGPVIRDYC